MAKGFGCARCTISTTPLPGRRSGRPWNSWSAKARYAGSSSFAGWDIATAQNTAAARNFLGLASEQSLYNLTARTVELEVIPALRYYGVGLIPWSPLAGGLLGGVLQQASEGRRGSEQTQRQIDHHRTRRGGPASLRMVRTRSQNPLPFLQGQADAHSRPPPRVLARVRGPARVVALLMCFGLAGAGVLAASCAQAACPARRQLCHLPATPQLVDRIHGSRAGAGAATYDQLGR